MSFQMEWTQNLLLLNNLTLVHLELYFLQIKLIDNMGGFVVFLNKNVPWQLQNQITYRKKKVQLQSFLKKFTEP